MIHCCELICHVNLTQQNVNTLHFTLGKNKCLLASVAWREAFQEHLYPSCCIYTPSRLAGQFSCRWLGVQSCDCLQECGCNQVCDDTAGFAASDYRRTMCAFLRPLCGTGWCLSQGGLSNLTGASQSPALTPWLPLPSATLGAQPHWLTCLPGCRVK